MAFFETAHQPAISEGQGRPARWAASDSFKNATTLAPLLAREDPTPQDPETVWQQAQVNAHYGIRTINEFRKLIGLYPVPCHNEAWLPTNFAPVSQPRTTPPKPQGKSANPAGSWGDT